MLDPEYLDRAADLVGGVYQQIEAEMLDVLVRAMLSDPHLASRDMTALNLLAQSQAPALRRVLEEHAGEVDEAVRRTVQEALDRSARADYAAVGRDGRALPRQVERTVAGIAAILARDNLDMEEGARQAFLDRSAWAVTQVNTGALTADRAIRRAVRDLERRGVTVVSYRDGRTGRKTVRNGADVAVRRHVRTQIAQDGARDTLARLPELGCELVEVSSHAGARPSHRPWQGYVYAISGPRTVDGVTYEDLASATGYGSVDGLCGANCRHSFGPWMPGMPRAYGHDPEHPSGLDPDEVYALTQRQRALERSIREAKRELAGATRLHESDPSLANLAERARAERALRERQERIRKLISGANARSKTGKAVLARNPAREWAGDMPRGKGVRSANRTLGELLGGPGAQRAMRAAGVSRTALERELRSLLREQGMGARGFSLLPAREQREMLSSAVASAQSRTRRAATEKTVKRMSESAQPIWATDRFGRNVRTGWKAIGSTGGYVVAGHGSSKRMIAYGTSVDDKAVARAIKARADYHGGPIRLVSCSTGDDSSDAPCFAQRLADRMGETVYAPSDTVWVFPDGRMVIGPSWRYNTGKWNTFKPRGRK